jgi:hypothetical protein
MDPNTRIAIQRYLRSKHVEVEWLESGEQVSGWLYNLNVYHEDERTGLNLSPKTFREIVDDLMRCFSGCHHLPSKKLVLYFRSVKESDGYERSYLYYNPESNGRLLTS